MKITRTHSDIKHDLISNLFMDLPKKKLSLISPPKLTLRIIEPETLRRSTLQGPNSTPPWPTQMDSDLQT